MELIKRLAHANIYDDGPVLVDGVWRRKRRAILGGVPNVPIDLNGNLAPFDNRLDVITTHPLAGYVIKQGPFWLGFHDKVNNKYASAVRLYTGEQMIVRLDGANPQCTPTVINGRVLEWNYGAAGWIRQYATERHIKEILLQKAGRAIAFRYSLTGLTPELSADKTQAIMRRSNGQVAFTIERPYYITAQGAFDGYCPVSWAVDNGDYVVTLAAPATDRLVDPTINFGEGAGYTAGDHKDNSIAQSNPSFNYASSVVMYAGCSGATASTKLAALMRFSLTGHIAATAVVNSATLHLFLVTAPASNIVLSVRKLITAWGITPTEEGTGSGSGSSSGQGSWRRAIDYNGTGGDVDWASAGAFSVSDYNAAETTISVASTDAVGTEYTASIPVMALAWVNNDATNYGLVLEQSATATAYAAFDSQESTTSAERPYLAIDYTELVPLSCDSIDPLTGAPGATVAIAGSGFGTSGLTATFTDADSTVHNVTPEAGYTDIEASFVVPATAVAGAGTWALTNADSQSDTVAFTVVIVSSSRVLYSSLSVGVGVGI